eukprot:Platyproteum_vivax@DN17280_c0_g1_i1.p2
MIGTGSVPTPIINQSMIAITTAVTPEMIEVETNQDTAAMTAAIDHNVTAAEQTAITVGPNAITAELSAITAELNAAVPLQIGAVAEAGVVEKEGRVAMKITEEDSNQITEPKCRQKLTQTHLYNIFHKIT